MGIDAVSALQIADPEERSYYEIETTYSQSPVLVVLKPRRPPPPPPPPPEKSAEEVRASEQAARRRAAGAKGRASTILTSSDAGDTETGGKKTLLGE